MSNAVDRPLLLYGVAEEDEDKGEDDGPRDDDGAGAVDPELELDAKGPVVEAELAELQGCECPEVD